MAHAANAEGFSAVEAAPAGRGGRWTDTEGVVRVRILNGGERVALSGELCSASAPWTEHCLRRLERCDLPVAALDLRELSFIDLTGLDVIAAWEARARQRGQAVQVIPGTCVMRLRELIEADASGTSCLKRSFPQVQSG